MSNISNDSNRIIWQKIIDLLFNGNSNDGSLYQENTLDIPISNSNSNYDINIFEWMSKNIFSNSNYNLSEWNKNLNIDFNENNRKLFYNYDTNSNEYFDELINSKHGINYFSGSFSRTFGLEKSQLKTLDGFQNFCYSSSKWLSINGGPGTGKSTLLNYMFSNLILNNFLDQMHKQKEKNVNIVEFLKYEYNVPKILVSGTTKMSVENISNICKIEYPDNFKVLKWIESSNSDIDDFFHRLFFYYLILTILSDKK